MIIKSDICNVIHQNVSLVSTAQSVAVKFNVYSYRLFRFNNLQK